MQHFLVLKTLRIIFESLFVLIVGVLIGLFLTDKAIHYKWFSGKLQIGVWQAWPDVGVFDANPYARAVLSRDAVLPLGAAEGMTFSAFYDDMGRNLSGDCDYRIHGKVPSTRFWSLTIYDQEGHVMPNPANRFGFHSEDILWHQNGHFEIIVARYARPGNWIPHNGTDQMRFVLRLYNTAIGSSLLLEELDMPKISRETCR